MTGQTEVRTFKCERCESGLGLDSRDKVNSVHSTSSRCLGPETGERTFLPLAERTEIRSRRRIGSGVGRRRAGLGA